MIDRQNRFCSSRDKNPCSCSVVLTSSLILLLSHQQYPCGEALVIAPTAMRLPASPTRPSNFPRLHDRRSAAIPTTHMGYAATLGVLMSASATADNGGEQGSGQLETENVVIIGSGPAGYTAAIYAGRANLKPLVFEGISVGPPGGQLMTTTEVENFPGFPEGVTGPELMAGMRQQGARWGAVFETEDVESVDFSERPFVIRSTSRTVKAQTVILATGATAKRLGVPSEGDFWGRGISACAICDGAAPMFRDAELGVVGGGDSAVEEAVYLTKYSPKVHLFVRGQALSASRAMIDRLAAESSVEVHLGTTVENVLGNGGGDCRSGSPVTGVLVRDDHGTREVPVRGLFYAIGHSPNTNLLQNQVKLDPQGYVMVRPGTPKTSVQGVFAAGDVQDREWRQAVTAAGSGCMAALAAERFLAAKGVLREVHQIDAKARPRVKKKVKKELLVETSKTFNINETKHAGSYALRRLYHESSRPIVVKYVSPTCGPCKALSPILLKVVDEMASDVHYVEIDIAASPDMAESAGITGTPTVQIFRDKALLDTVRGVKSKNEYRQRIKNSMMVEADV